MAQLNQVIDEVLNWVIQARKQFQRQLYRVLTLLLSVVRSQRSWNLHPLPDVASSREPGRHVMRPSVERLE
jgi:hypothetical protein